MSQQQPGVLGKLLKPGWEAAEIVIPVLHKCLLALLFVLLYTAQHNEGPLRVHLLCMAGLTLGLWASVAWFVGEYRRALAAAKANDNATTNEGSEDERDAKQQQLPATAVTAVPGSGATKPVRYTD